MSRPLRIEFKGAWYHVTNRGGGHRDLFKNNLHRETFLTLLQEITEMFHVEVHVYCLMNNHYHLLLHTPKGNLGRALRHLGGVYTQRFNRIEHTDGQLFRGRYKAILVEESSYLLWVSRYIHLSPVVTGAVNKAVKHHWSSYLAYIGKEAAATWLFTHKILGMIGKRSVKKRYKAFVDLGIDSKTEEFYGKKRQPPVYGSSAFISNLGKKIIPQKEVPESLRKLRDLTINNVVSSIATINGITRNELLTATQGCAKANIHRNMAIYVCRRYFGIELNEIAAIFGMGHYSSASSVVTRFKNALLADDKLQRRLDRVVNILMTDTKI